MVAHNGEGPPCGAVLAMIVAAACRVGLTVLQYQRFLRFSRILTDI
jgi:hypothetical protein